MAEKLLTGASFKAPDWTGPKAAPANSANPSAAAATAQHADTAMLDAGANAAESAVDAASSATSVAAATMQSASAAAPAAYASAFDVAMQIDAAHMPPATAAHRPQQQPDQAARPPEQPPVPAAARQPMAVIRQPGWQPALQAQPHSPCPLQKLQCVQPPPPQPVTHVNDLPDDLLQRIFSMLPFRKRRRLGKVCCHWRALCGGPSQMWHQVELRCREDLMEAPLPRGSGACSLQPVFRDRRMCGPGFRDWEVPGAAPEPEAVPMAAQASRHLRWLAPRLTAVRELALVDWPTDTEPALLPAVAAALQGCAALRGLRLGCHLLPSGCAPLQRLPPGLRTLHIDCMFGCQPAVQAALSAALARLAHLQELRLGLQMQAGAAEIEFPIGVLACSGLVRLRIEAIAGRLCSALPDGIGRLTRLRSLQLPDCGASQLPASIAQLTALSELDLRSTAAPMQHALALPPCLAALQGLLVLSITADCHSPLFASLGGLTRLEVNGLASVAEAQRIATDFWQLHAPAGAPLGARDITRSQSPLRRSRAAPPQGGASSHPLDRDESCEEGVSRGIDDNGVAMMDTESSRQPAPATEVPLPAPAAAAAAVAAMVVRAPSPPAFDSGGRRWRIEWRKATGARAAAQYVPPPGSHLRAMLLSVADM